MFNSTKSFLLMVLATSASVPSAQAEVRPLLDAFCVRCHGEKKPKADLALHKLTDAPVKRAEIDAWRSVLDQVEIGAMPPEGAKQPSAQERQQLAAAIKGMLRSAGASIDEARWLAPARGNWIDHDALFSGRPVDPAATRPRLWRLTGQAYEEFMKQKNVQFKLGIKTYGQDMIRAPWELRGQKEFSDYASAHKIGEADLEYHLRNATRVAKLMVGKFAGGRPSSNFADWLGELNVVIKAGKTATPEQVTAAVIASFDKVLSRQPGSAECERYAGFFKKSLDALGGERGSEQFLTALLLDPQVLYRVELPGAEGARSMMPPRLLARAIALALTDNEPDRELSEAAATGKLASAADVRVQVERLLRDPNLARTRVVRFFQEYFGYPGAIDVFKDEVTMAEYGIPRGGWIPAFFVADTDRLVQWALDADKKVLYELLTTPKTFLLTGDSKIARGVKKGNFTNAGVRVALGIYEIALKPQEWSDSKPFDMPAEHRMGILTHPSWLAAHSTNFDNHAIDRGRWVREKLLGGRIPEIPITVDATLPDEPHLPLRQRMRVTKEEYCWQCHRHIDPLGLPFEQYDHFGRYRTAELVVDKEATEQKGRQGKLGTRIMKTVPLDATGTIEGSGDPSLDGPVEGPRELILKLAKSERVEQVFVRHVFRYFLGRNETLSDGPTLVAAHRAYRDSGGSMNALLTSLLTSDSFLYRSRN